METPGKLEGALFLIGWAAKIIVFILVGAGLIFLVWNEVFAESITFVHTIAYWQALLIQVWLTLVINLILLKFMNITYIKGDKNETNSKSE